ncbi:MAG: DUF4038 domain-containing protein [Armatimonadetes bacterium]|nr:DUF4038 domain-containing protein [Armatimonadota bacterium]
MHRFLIITAAGIAVAAGHGEAAVEVPRWHPHDFAFTSRAARDNPFRVSFDARVKGPGGIEFTVPGFYDGNQTWKIRVSPTALGGWSLVTRSDDPALSGKAVAFLCKPNPDQNAHGGLRVDKEHLHHFIYEDGTRYSLVGYECDWLWALDMNDARLPTLNRFLDKLTASGFSYIILNAYAHDTGWRKGKTGPDDFGPPPLFAWEGTNENPDHSRFNLAYWRHYDRVIEALHRRGITAHIMAKVYNKMVHWPEKGGPDDDLYFRWLVARYAAYPNIVWGFSKEAHYETDLAYKLSRFALLKETDPYHRPITDHDDDANYDKGAFDGLLDFRADQHHDNWHETILRQRGQRAWPVVNVEFGYEYGPKGIEDFTYAVVQPPEEVARRAWEICTAGGYTAYYYTYAAWDVIRPEGTPPGYAHFKRLRAFFEQTRYWLMNPSDALASEGYCLADPGREYIVFLNRAKSFTLTLEGVSGMLHARWYHPFIGEYKDAGVFGAGKAALTPPSDWGKGPVALHMK